jgi:hypothetical protein
MPTFLLLKDDQSYAVVMDFCMPNKHIETESAPLTNFTDLSPS